MDVFLSLLKDERMSLADYMVHLRASCGPWPQRKEGLTGSLILGSLNNFSYRNGL